MVFRPLCPVVGFDAFLREGQSRKFLRRALRTSAIDFGVRNPQGFRSQRQVVECLRVRDEGLVAPRHHIVDDGSDRLIDILGNLALAR